MESRLPAARPSNLTALHAASHAVYNPNANYNTNDSARPLPVSAPSPRPPLDSQRPSATPISSSEQDPDVAGHL